MIASYAVLSNRRIVSGLLLYVVLAFSPAQAETTKCKVITSIPYNITTQGVYCFTRNLGTKITKGAAIKINANNVTIDMNGFKLNGLGSGTATDASGISATNRKIITIRNGAIQGFFTGIDFDDESGTYTTSRGHLIEDIVFDRNREAGIWMEGQGNTIRRNTVMGTGGGAISTNIYGITVKGPSNDVLNNRVTNTTADNTGSAYGIFLEASDNSVVQGNRVGDTTATGTGNGSGILMYQSDHVTVKDNAVATADFGVSYDGGGTGSSGKYMGNLTNNISLFPFTGGTAVGTND